MNEILGKIVENKEILIKLLVNFIVTFLGSFLAISLFMNMNGLVPRRIPMPPQPAVMPPASRSQMSTPMPPVMPPASRPNQAR